MQLHLDYAKTCLRRIKHKMHKRDLSALYLDYFHVGFQLLEFSPDPYRGCAPARPRTPFFSASRFTGFLKTSVRVAVTSLAGALLHHVISLQQSEQTAALRPLTIVAAAAAAASAKLLLSAKCCL